MAWAGAVVIGAGFRGRSPYRAYALAHPDRLRIEAACEPDLARREAMARAHGLSSDRVFQDWKELLDRPQLALVAIDAGEHVAHWHMTHS